MLRSICCTASLIAAAALMPLSALAQQNPMCAGLEKVAGWKPDGDATQAAPQYHRVLLDNETMRVLEVTVLPGQTETTHHHRWPSIMVVDSLPAYVNYDAQGKEIKPAVARAQNPELPLVGRLAPQEAHYIKNTGDKPFHAIRIEYKQLCP